MKMLLAALLIFAIAPRHYVAQTSSLTKIYKFPEAQVDTFGWPFNDDAYFIYIRCNSSHEASKRCIVGMKFNAFENTTESTKECNIILKAMMPNVMGLSISYLFRLGQDKILVFWTEILSASCAKDQDRTSILKSTVVHMFDNCQSVDVNVHHSRTEKVDDEVRGAVIFEDTYELIIEETIKECPSNFFKTFCNFFGLCEKPECFLIRVGNYIHYEFDSHGRKLSGPERWPDPPLTHGESFVTSAELSYPNKGYFISTWNSTSYLVELVDKRSLGNETIKISQKSSEDFNSAKRYIISLANEAIGLSYVIRKSGVVCWRASRNGKMQVKRQFTFQHPYRVKLENMYNLRNGGLLLAVIKYEKDEDISYKYDLMKVDAKGQLGSVEVHFNEKCECYSAYVKMFENEKGEYCIVRSCDRIPDEPGRLEISVKCYSDDDFSECDDCL